VDGEVKFKNHSFGKEELRKGLFKSPTKFENYEALRSEDYEFKVRTTI
jgi:hypothetical protein